jgi:hypothetical protein
MNWLNTDLRHYRARHPLRDVLAWIGVIIFIIAAGVQPCSGQSFPHDASLAPVDAQLESDDSESESGQYGIDYCEDSGPPIWRRLAIFASGLFSSIWLTEKSVAVNKQRIFYVAVAILLSSGSLLLVTCFTWSWCWWL